MDFCRRVVEEDEKKKNLSNRIDPTENKNRIFNSKLDGSKLFAATLYFWIDFCNHKLDIRRRRKGPSWLEIRDF